MARETLHDHQVLPWAEIVRNIERVRQMRAADIDGGKRERAERLHLAERGGFRLRRLETVLGHSAVTSFKYSWRFLLVICLVIPLAVPVWLMTS